MRTQLTDDISITEYHQLVILNLRYIRYLAAICWMSIPDESDESILGMAWKHVEATNRRSGQPALTSCESFLSDLSREPRAVMALMSKLDVIEDICVLVHCQTAPSADYI